MVNIFLKANVHKVKSSATKAYTESTLFSIVPVDKLLSEIEKAHYLNKLQEIVSLPDDHFKVFYEDIIDNFAVFVQAIPEVYGQELGGLLNDGLRRGLLAIRLLHENQDTRPHPLYTYAIYTIALFSDLGQILSYRIMISDEKGAFIDDWYPYLGPMTEFGEYYKIRPYEGIPTALTRSVTPLFARQLLNDTAITWLSSNTQIFDMWLAFLNKGEDWAGGIGRVLRIERKDFDNKKQEIGLVPIEIPRTEPMDTDLGEKFLAWLKNALEDGTISVNESNSLVHVVKTSDLDISVFLQAPELFQQFINVYAKTRDWVVVCKNFNHLGLTELSGVDVKFKQFFAETPEKSGKLGFLGQDKGEQSKLSLKEKSVLSSKMVSQDKSIKEGVVIKDAKMIFGAKVPPASQYIRDIEQRWTQESLPKILTGAVRTMTSEPTQNSSPKKK